MIIAWIRRPYDYLSYKRRTPEYHPSKTILLDGAIRADAGNRHGFRQS